MGFFNRILPDFSTVFYNIYGNPLQVSWSFEIVKGLGSPPQVITSSLPNGLAGEFYSETLQATGGTPPYSWNIIAGSLPNGLSLDSSTGVISGTPMIDGTLNFTVEVNDSVAQTAAKSLSITIRRTPIIVIPGLTGSLLNDGFGTPEWPFSVLKGLLGDPQNLQFNSDGTPRTDTNSANLSPTGIIDDIDIPIIGDVTGFYDFFINFLTVNGYIESNFTISNGQPILPQDTLFKFLYDWRRSVRFNALLLQATIERIVESPNTTAAKVDLIAHSMGGMVAIEAIKNLNLLGKPYVGKLIMVGTPHLGSPKTLATLRYGIFDLPQIDPKKGKRAAHNMPGVYDLLPSRTYVDSKPTIGYFMLNGQVLNYDQTRNKLETQPEVIPPFLQSDDPEPLNVLSSTLLSQSEAFHAVYDNWTKPNNIKAYIIAGHGQATLYHIAEFNIVNKPTAILRSNCEGDGTVPLDSATALNGMAVDQIYYADLPNILNLSDPNDPLNHGKMLSGQAIQDLILNLLNGAESIPSAHQNTLRIQKPTPQPCISLEVASPVRLDVYDSQGRHTGIDANGLVETQIPGSSFYEIGGSLRSKFITVPDNDNYQVLITALAAGEFDLAQTKGVGEAINRIEVYKRVRITSATVAQLDYSPNTVNQILKLDIDGDGNFETQLSPDAVFNGPQFPIEVAVDIKPGSYPNSINLGSKGNVPIAILSSTAFDATTVDPTTVTLTNAPVKLKKNGTPMASFDDVDGDGLSDLVIHIDTQALQLSQTSTKAVLVGKRSDGFDIIGADSVNIVAVGAPLPPSLLPKETRLLMVFPSPANPEVWIPYLLSSNNTVIILIYDVQGRLVRTLNLGFQSAGFYESKAKAAYWDGRNARGEAVASGIYFYTLQAGDFTASRKLLILR